MRRQNCIALEIDKRRSRMNITQLRKMSTSERLQAMEMLWDSALYMKMMQSKLLSGMRKYFRKEKKKLQVGVQHPSHSPISKRVASNENN
jgi:hypothetical protein